MSTKKLENISRRGFLKGTAAGVVGVATSSILAGCTPEVINETNIAANNNASSVVVPEDAITQEDVLEIPSSPVDGVYLTKALGHEDFIYVKTLIYDGVITSCSVVSHNETVGVGNFACARIPKAIVEHQSVNVPNVRGCSTSSEAIKKAVREAILISGNDTEKFETLIVEEDINSSEEKDVDVVIMGAGTSGLVCAVKLLDLGFKVAIVEKRDIPGGSSPMTYSGLNATGTETIHNYNVDNSLPDSYLSPEAKLATKTYDIDPENDKYDGTLPFEKPVIYNLKEVGEFYQSIGIGFLTLGSYEGGYQIGAGYTMAPGMYMGGCGYTMMALASRIQRHPNGEIIFKTKVTELIQDSATKQITGLKAVGIKSDDSTNGYELTVNAKAVVLASGGFARNKSMLAEYIPETKDLYFNCASASEGQGIQLGLDAGSKMECLGRHLPGFLSSDSYFELAFIHYSTPGIMVDDKGANVGNISSGNHHRMAEFAVNNPNGKYYYIFDESSVPALKDWEMFNMTTYSALFNRGEVWHYDTVEEAATELGLNGLADAIDANNTASLSGEPDEFGRAYCPYIETRNGIYIVPVLPNLYLTTGGICIDPDGKVLTESYVADGDNTVIPGLYACGDVCGSLEEKDGRPYGYGYDHATGMGWQVAKTIDSELAETSAE